MDAYMTPGDALILGGGLVGPLAACMLCRRGWNVTLLERRPDPREGDRTGGRSINLSLSHRGIRALQAEGLAERVLADVSFDVSAGFRAASGRVRWWPPSRAALAQSRRAVGWVVVAVQLAPLVGRAGTKGFAKASISVDAQEDMILDRTLVWFEHYPRRLAR